MENAKYLSRKYIEKKIKSMCVKPHAHIKKMHTISLEFITM